MGELYDRNTYFKNSLLKNCLFLMEDAFTERDLDYGDDYGLDVGAVIKPMNIFSNLGRSRSSWAWTFCRPV